MESERIITITDKELGEILMEHKGVAMEINSISKEIESLDTKRKELIVDLQKFNDKIKNLVEEATAGKLDVYEVLLDANTDADNSDIINIKVVDRLKFAKQELDKEIASKEEVSESKELADDSE